MRHPFLLACLSLVVASAALHAGEKTKRPPNIVFVLTDDLGIFDVGCYGRKDQPTPNLDRLAKQGARFMNAYAAQSVCSPTRAALFTGKSPARLRITTFLPGRGDAPSQLLLHPAINQRLPASETTIAARLRALGYISALIGKWHLGGKGSLPTDHGFDLYFPGHAKTEPSKTEGGKGEYELTARAEKFMEESKGKPFLLFLCHNNPHIPLVAKANLIKKHKDAFNPIYAAMIETLDDSVGRVLAKLDALGIADETIVVFTSDNGGLHVLEGILPATFNGIFRAGKGFLYEGGVRVPQIVRWPGHIPAGKEIPTPVITTDWTPTFLEIAGAKTKDRFDGVSLASLLTNGTALPERALYWHIPHYTNQGSRPSGAIREKDWKLIEHYENGACELYNLASDPGEKKDLGAMEPGRVAELRGKLEKWRRDMEAQGNEANPHFSGRLWKTLYVYSDPSRFPVEKTAALMAKEQAGWRKGMNEVIKPKAAGGAGAVILHAKDAKAHGSKLRYEPQPQKDTLGFWVSKDDWVEWTFDFPSAGRFEVEVLQGCGKGNGGSEVEVEVAGKKLAMKVVETGHFQRFVPRSIGVIEVGEAGKGRLSVKVKSRAGGAVMDLRRVTLKGVE